MNSDFTKLTDSDDSVPLQGGAPRHASERRRCMFLAGGFAVIVVLIILITAAAVPHLNNDRVPLTISALDE